MRTPTRVQRLLMAATSLAGLMGILAGSFSGPVTAGSLGPPSPSAEFQLQLLEIATLLSALSMVLAVWRSPGLMASAPVLCGFVAVGVGAYLAFGYWVPAPHGAFSAPFTLQGSILLLWGLGACVLTLLFSVIRHQKAPALASLSHLTR